MPELPEVQSFVDALNSQYQGRPLDGVVFHRDSLRYPLEIPRLRELFARGETLEHVFRSGKQLVLRTTAGEVSVSLGMSGRFSPSVATEPQSHEHITVHFRDGSPPLGYVDPRRFGFWKVRSRAAEEITAVDPLDEASLVALFQDARWTGARRSVKDLLMDQAAIGGVGNIYALEALFSAGIHPQRSCSEVTARQWRSLARVLPPLLRQAIIMGGSSISTYRGLHGKAGQFQSIHRVYGRAGERCALPRCTATIERIVQGGRSSWYCPRCQK